MRPSTGGTAVIVATAALDVPNPLVTGSAYMQDVNRHLLFTPLLRFDEELELAPYLAESWQTEGDSVAIFHLRRDSRWSDGAPVTAHDAAFTFDRALDPATGYPNAGAFARWRGVEAVDSFTLRVSFDPHREPLMGVPLLPILPVHRLGSIPAERLRTAAFNQDPVGNGPFHLQDQREGGRWVFVANPDFPEGLGGRPRLDRLVWRTVPESQAQVAELLTGQAHVALEPSAARFDSLRARPGLRGIEKPSLRYSFIGWNGRRAPFDDPRVRRAFTLALDRQAILRSFRGGYGSPAIGPVPPAHWAHAAAVRPLPHDPDRARELLEEAGFRERDRDPVLQGPDGEELSFQLLIPAGSDLNRSLSQLIQYNLAGVGVKAEIQPMDFATIIQRITSPERRFDAVLLALDVGLRIDLASLFHSDAMAGPFQIASYREPRVDSLLDALEQTSDRGAARSVWSEVQRILNEDQPWTFLYYYPELVLVTDELQGITMDLRGTLRTAPDWWLEAPPNER